MSEARPGTTLIDDLPPGDWKLRAVGDFIIAVCPQHAPRVYRNGKYDGTLDGLFHGDINDAH